MPSVWIKPVQEKWPYPPWEAESSVQSVRTPVECHGQRPPHCGGAAHQSGTPAAGTHLAAWDLSGRGRQSHVALALYGRVLYRVPRDLHVQLPTRPTAVVLSRLDAE